MAKISIIIPSHRENIIRSTCRKLLTLENINQCEVIIVTDYNTDKLQSEFSTLQWYNIDNKSIPAKRNFAIKKSSAPIVAMMDDDCLPEQNWITEGLNYLKNNPDIVGVEGQTSIESSNPKLAHFKRFKRLEKPGYRTNNIFYRKSALEEIDFFDERFEFQREDTDLAFSLLEKNLNIEFSENIKVTHLFREKEKWDLLKNYYNRRYDPLLHKKHSKNYRKYIKSPVTKSSLYVLAIYIFFIFTLFIYYAFSPLFTAITFSFLISGYFISHKNTSIKHPILTITEFISYLLSPFVLWGALLYGSLRFKHFLLF